MKAKQTSSSIKKPLLIMGIAFIALGCTLGASSFAWFLLPSSTKQVNGMDGEATGSYFSPVNEDGKADGTKDHPYGIKNAKQLYYFNWLQDLGYFNKDANEDNVIDQQCYFVLMNDIDASNYVLPPAGTKDYPFVGNFDGAGYKISNLKISNSWDDLTNIPKGAQQDSTETMLSNAEIVGFFGIIGQYSSDASSTADSVTTGSVNCKGKDGNVTEAAYTIRSVSGTGDEAVTTYVNAVSNLYFDNLNVSTVADKTLAGLLAGYVNGQMQYCGVRSGYFSFSSDVGVIQDDVIGTTNDKLSKYSIIGDYNSLNFAWVGKPKSQGGEDFGNSIDIYTVSKRLAFMMHNYDSSKSTNPGKNNYAIYGSDTFHILTAISLSDQNHDYNYTSSGKMSAGLLSGTYIPLSVSDESLSMQGETKVDNATAEIIDDKNGGYIVGGGSSSYSGATVQLRNNVQNNSKTYASMYNGIQNSMTTTSGQTLTMSKANLSFLYYDTLTNTTYRLLDDDNKNTTFEMSAPGTGTTASVTNKTVTDGMFNNYANVKTNLVSTLNSATAGAVSAGTFESGGGILEPGVQFRKQTSLETLTATGEIKIAGTTYSSYQFYKGGIDFTLKKDGYVSVVVGTYNSATKPPFYKLYALERSESNGTSTISSAQEIKDISGSFSNKNLSYKYLSGQESTYDENKKVFSFETISASTGVFYTYSAYFMEIPLKKGSYFMTSGTDSANFPFILYFDIGQDKTGSGDSGAETETPDIDFVYYKENTKTILPINDSSFVSSNIAFTISGSPTKVYFWRKDSTSGVYYCYVTTSSGADVIGFVGDGAKKEGSIDDYNSQTTESTTSN